MEKVVIIIGTCLTLYMIMFYLALHRHYKKYREYKDSLVLMQDIHNKLKVVLKAEEKKYESSK